MRKGEVAKNIPREMLLPLRKRHAPLSPLKLEYRQSLIGVTW